VNISRACEGKLAPSTSSSTGGAQTERSAAHEHIAACRKNRLAREGGRERARESARAREREREREGGREGERARTGAERERGGGRGGGGGGWTGRDGPHGAALAFL
jgi:hypothetical protein